MNNTANRSGETPPNFVKPRFLNERKDFPEQTRPLYPPSRPPEGDRTQSSSSQQEHRSYERLLSRPQSSQDNLSMNQCQTLAEIQHVFSKQGSIIETVALSAGMVAAARLHTKGETDFGRGGAGHRRSVDAVGAEQLLRSAAPLIAQNIGNMSFRNVANIMWALAKMRDVWPAPNTLKLDSFINNRDSNKTNSQSKTHQSGDRSAGGGWRGGTGGRSTPGGILGLQYALLRRGVDDVASANWQEVTNVLWACGQSRLRDHDSMRALSLYITAHGELPETSQGSASKPHGGYFGQGRQSWMKQGQQLNTDKVEGTAIDTTTSGGGAGDGALQQGQVSNQAQSLATSNLALMSGQDCTMSLWGLAQMEYKNVHLLRHICTHLQAILEHDLNILQGTRKQQMQESQVGLAQRQEHQGGIGGQGDDSDAVKRQYAQLARKVSVQGVENLDGGGQVGVSEEAYSSSRGVNSSDSSVSSDGVQLSKYATAAAAPEQGVLLQQLLKEKSGLSEDGEVGRDKIQGRNVKEKQGYSNNSNSSESQHGHLQNNESGGRVSHEAQLQQQQQQQQQQYRFQTHQPRQQYQTQQQQHENQYLVLKSQQQQEQVNSTSSARHTPGSQVQQQLSPSPTLTHFPPQTQVNQPRSGADQAAVESSIAAGMVVHDGSSDTSSLSQAQSTPISLSNVPTELWSHHPTRFKKLKQYMQEQTESGNAFKQPVLAPLSYLFPEQQPASTEQTQAGNIQLICAKAPDGQLFDLESLIKDALGVSNARGWLQQHRSELQYVLESQGYSLVGPPEWEQVVAQQGQQSPLDPMVSEALLESLANAQPLNPAPSPTATAVPHPQLQLSTQNLANTLWALAKLKFNKHPVLAVLASNLCERHQDLTPREVANCAWACGQLYLQHGALIGVLLSHVSTLLQDEARGARVFEEQHLSQIASCLESGLGHAYLNPVQRELVNVVCMRGKSMAPRELCSVAHGLAMSNYVDDKLMDHIAQRLCGLKSPNTELHVLDVSQLLQAMARQKHMRPIPWYNRSLYDLLTEHLSVNYDSLSERQRTNAVWALGMSGHYNKEVFTKLMRGVGANLDEADGLFCANQVVQGMGRLGVIPCEATVKNFKSQLMQSLTSWPHPMVPSVAVNLAILELLEPQDVEAIFFELNDRMHGKAAIQLQQKGQVQGRRGGEPFELTYSGYSQLYQAHMVVEHTLGMKLLPAALIKRSRDYWKETACSRTISQLQQEVRDVVLQQQLKHVDIHEEYMAQDGLFSLDLAIIIRPNTVASVQNSASGGVVGESRAIKVAVEVQGLPHFHRNSWMEYGWSRMKKRLLEGFGWRVVQVASYEWDWSNRQELIEKKLRESLPEYCFE